MYNLNLSVPGGENIYKAMQPEKEDLISKRAKVDFFLEKDILNLNIEASDFPSFRAMNSAVMRLITVFEKMNNLEDYK